ncbi:MULTISPECIES: helix-turn-helix domain-containing protein [Allobacillus]|uniref:Helix-turn-helix transcriptional regulator n=1 Tax=Allobacillus salarius TaxID=1955272 RepID=A0A556PPE0_9BACI|nr:helix-turn-helix domain-containing protein [Allobacillus salarius]TSJ66262.1 helix-turn-helix transcriptional regulator [Allobacillus salarius]
MYWYKIGEILKEKRKELLMTQGELSEGICSQAQISKLENGEEIPSSITLYMLAQRLGVDSDYFFKRIESERIDYIEDVTEQIRSLVRERDYINILEIIEDQFNTPLLENVDFRQFLIWHKGVSVYYVHNNKEQALNLMVQALNLRRNNNHKFLNERELEIMNSIAILFNEDKNYSLSLRVFKQALSRIKLIPKIKDFTILIRLLYGASKSAMSLGKIEEALEFSERGLKVCSQYETLYLLGEHCYQKARCLKRLNDKKAEYYYEKAINTFTLEGKKQFANVVNEAFIEYKTELEKTGGVNK